MPVIQVRCGCIYISLLAVRRVLIMPLSTNHDLMAVTIFFYILALTMSPMACGSMFCAGTSTSSITTCPVILARSENLPSILGALKPFMPFSRMKPRIRLLSMSDLAQTMNTSAIGLFVILEIQPQFQWVDH